MSSTLDTLAHLGVHEFVEAVRAALADLPEPTRDELTEGLEADLAERAAEDSGGRSLAELLGDPAAYAAELRAAAGLPAADPRPPGIGRSGLAITRLLDSAHESYERVLDAVPGRPRAFVESLRPVWWVIRAWAAWMCAQGFGSGSLNYDWWTLAVLGGFVAGSVQLGRGAWRLGVLRERAAGRLLLLGLNGFALVVTPTFVDDVMWDIAWRHQGQSWDPALIEGLHIDGLEVCNIYPYDAQGRPLTGVQLLDQEGRALSTQCLGGARSEALWTMGDQSRRNVYPHGRRAADGSVRMPRPVLPSLPAVQSPDRPVPGR